MSSIRHYLPLVGFVVPTVVIGYGFVIPCSPIAGVNQLTIGFGSTILGAVLTYVAGIRMALRPAPGTAVPRVCPVKPPWRWRLAHYLNRQASCPQGAFGRLLGVIWTLENRRVNRVALELLDIQKGDRVLEVGCGPGWAVREAAAKASHGHVTGLDISTTMVRAARRRNRGGIRRGEVSIQQVGEACLDLAPAAFDRIFSVHCIYFWKDPVDTLAQLRAALHRGGRLVLAFLPEGPGVAARFRGDVHRFYSLSEVDRMLKAAGFADATVVRGPGAGNGIAWIAATVATGDQAPATSGSQGPGAVPLSA